MSYQANVYQVMIASPSDVARERQLAREIIIEWNSVNSMDKGICLLPVGWEFNASPEMGGRAQDFINKQLLEDSDLLVGIFWTRIGTPTGSFLSGSVEEIEKHIEANKPAMLYFSSAPVVKDSIEDDQYQKLLKFKKDCLSRGLVESFDSPEDFRTKFTRQLALKIIQNDKFLTQNSSSNLEQTEYQNKDTKIIEALSESERQLLIEASKDPDGSIIKVSYMGGFDIQTNKARLNEDFEPRTRALWEETFNNLLAMNLIEERGYKGEIFALTLYGYKVADMLKTKE